MNVFEIVINVGFFAQNNFYDWIFLKMLWMDRMFLRPNSQNVPNNFRRSIRFDRANLLIIKKKIKLKFKIKKI